MGAGQPRFPISPITAQALCQVIYSLGHLSSECLTRGMGERGRNRISRLFAKILPCFSFLSAFNDVKEREHIHTL